MTKILFLIDKLGSGGAAKVLCNMVNGMDFSQFDVTVQTLWPDEGRKDLAAEIHYKWCYPKDTWLYQMLMRIEAQLGILYRLRIRDDYDVETAYLECGPTKIIASSTNKKALKLAWLHCDLKKQAGDLKKFVKKTSGYYRKFDGILCVSEDVRESFCRLYGNRLPTKTLYNCYNDREIHIKATERVALVHPDVPVGTVVGRLYAEKGIDRLLRVHRRLIQEGVKYQLWILGDGPDRPMLEKEIEDWNLKDSVRLLGFQRNPYPFIQMSDFLICSSFREGFSTVAIEGLILGKTMVTTQCAGMEEIFGCNECGLITQNNEEGLYLGIKRILTEPELLRQLSEKAALRGRDFTQEHGVRKIEQFIKASLEAKIGKN